MTTNTTDSREPVKSRWSGRPNAAADALLDELAESPLPGARYARDVVRRRLPAIEEQAAAEARRELLAARKRLTHYTTRLYQTSPDAFERELAAREHDEVLALIEESR